MFNEPGSDIVGDWIGFLILVPIIIVLVLIISKFTKTKIGKQVVKFLHKLFLAVTYPFYKIRSKLSDRGKSIYDGFFYVLYCVGAILLIMYGAS